MNDKGSVGLSEYNAFCKSLTEGAILYNLDKTNNWGDYLFVANICPINVLGQKTYTVLLMGLKKDKDKIVPRNIKIKLTPDYANNVSYLKCVGKCDFWLVPELSNIELNIGLIAVYGNTDLREYQRRLSIKKPKRRKYGKDGKLVIKKPKNE